MLAGHAFFAQAEVLVVEELGGGEAVVQLDQVEVSGPTPAISYAFFAALRVNVLMSGMTRSRSCHGSLVSTEASTRRAAFMYCRALSIERGPPRRRRPGWAAHEQRVRVGDQRGVHDFSSGDLVLVLGEGFCVSGGGS